jgi:electron transfer flavoprotein beta subunit
MAEWFLEWCGILGIQFLNSCTELTVDGTAATVREIDGKETVSTTLPLIIGGQKEEKDLRILT